MTEEERAEKRKAAAGSIFEEVWDNDFVQECFGAYKLEYTWGLANWSHVSDSPTAFGYTNWVHLYDDDYEDGGVYDRTMYSDLCTPVNIEFDIPDFRRAVREYATSYDDCDDGSEIMARQEALEKLRVWQAALDTLAGELEDELRSRANK